MNELSLFSGAGGGLLGTKLLGWRTIGYVENNAYCQKILQARIADGILDVAPIFGDIKKFVGNGFAAVYNGMVDVLTAGFPCQPFSVAGKRRGEKDERNMWPKTIEAIRIIRPRYLFLENVPGLLQTPYFKQILQEITDEGYVCQWGILAASDVGANHKRKRLWIVADSKCLERSQGPCENVESKKQKTVGTNIGDFCEVLAHPKSKQDRRLQSGRFQPHVSTGCANVADADRSRLPIAWTIGSEKTFPCVEPCSNAGEWWNVEPNVGRVAHGVASRVDRLKAIGNGQVPAVVKAVWRLMNP